MTISGEYRAARALDYFHQGYNCSQSVFTAFADVCGLSEETALRLSSPLGAGIGRMREVCGAFCGLSMVAGSLHGNTSPDTGEKEKIFSPEVSFLFTANIYFNISALNCFCTFAAWR